LRINQSGSFRSIVAGEQLPKRNGIESRIADKTAAIRKGKFERFDLKVQFSAVNEVKTF